jgi:hypothetical protein
MMRIIVELRLKLQFISGSGTQVRTGKGQAIPPPANPHLVRYGIQNVIHHVATNASKTEIP